MKLNKQWFLALSFAIAGICAALAFSPTLKASDAPAWGTTEYILVKDADLDTTNDAIIVIGKPSAQEELPISTGAIGSLPRCGSKCSASACSSTTTDSDFPTASTYFGSFIMAASTNNTKASRLTNTFYKDNQPNPGKKGVSLTLMSDLWNPNGQCVQEVDGSTWTFRKYSMTMD